ncbi:MAG TPA: Trm112 family protein [Nitrososphaeraceae archaeon]|nr:Trm112 family protein [Nitrososphaeraceae archaeon]
MKKHMLDILACPIDKNYPLELIELNVKELEKDKIKENYHPLNSEENNNIVKKNKNSGGGNKVNEINQNDEKVIVVIDGILYCKKCSRFYPIIDEIPIMLPDELREKEKDLQFLKKWKHTIPEEILTQSNPWHL